MFPVFVGLTAMAVSFTGPAFSQSVLTFAAEDVGVLRLSGREPHPAAASAPCEGKARAGCAPAGTRKRPGTCLLAWFRLNGAAPESNRPSRGLHDRSGFEDRLGHRAHAAPRRD